LMDKVMATVLDALLHTPNNFLCGLPLFGTALVLDLIKLALCFGKSGFFFAEEARVFYELTIRQGREGFQPNVNADCLGVFRKAFGFIFAGQANIPFFALSAHRTGFDCARTKAVYFGFHLPDFGERDRALPDAVSVLRVGDAVILAFAFKPRIAGFFTRLHPAEEGLKSEFHADSDILQDLTMNRSQFGMIRLPRCHCLLLLIQSRRLALRFIADGSRVNKAIIDITADSQSLIERSLLRVIGVHPVFYANLVHAYSIPQYSVKCSKRDTNKTKGFVVFGKTTGYPSP